MRLNFKRLGLLGAHVARAYARHVGLTSARFDLMTTLLAKARRQREIAAILCVSESVISRMVAALEEAGLVSRSIPAYDRRVRYVALTSKGRARIEVYANDEELRLPSDGRESMQCLGEEHWCTQWEAVLERLGLGSLLPVITTQPFEITEPIPSEPPFWAMQRHIRLGTYRTTDGYLPLDPIDADAPGRVQRSYDVFDAAPPRWT